mmetsp:Transcript_105810/g.167040  ORF Transcript_105810/g.167040 Transcript_105810/m.167040 type:complete len:89 (-) Transcript_105810:9-275(-)
MLLVLRRLEEYSHVLIILLQGFSQEAMLRETPIATVEEYDSNYLQAFSSVKLYALKLFLRDSLMSKRGHMQRRPFEKTCFLTQSSYFV